VQCSFPWTFLSKTVSCTRLHVCHSRHKCQHEVKHRPRRNNDRMEWIQWASPLRRNPLVFVVSIKQKDETFTAWPVYPREVCLSWQTVNAFNCRHARPATFIFDITRKQVTATVFFLWSTTAWQPVIKNKSTVIAKLSSVSQQCKQPAH